MRGLLEGGLEVGHAEREVLGEGLYVVGCWVEVVWRRVGVVGCVGRCERAGEVVEDGGQAVVFVKAAQGTRSQLQLWLVWWLERVGG